MKILITDDHSMVRQGLRLLLADHFNEVVIGEARSADEAVRRVSTEAWDIVLLDITMPGRNGVEALADIKQLRPRLPVLMLSMHPEDQLALRLLRAGAAGYLTKENAAEELGVAIEKVVSGGRYISPALAGRIASSAERKEAALEHHSGALLASGNDW